MDVGVDTQPKSFPPPSNLTDYARKPLPALPLYDRRSLASSFGSEVDHAFTTPLKTDQDGCPLIFEWEREGSGKSVKLYHHNAVPENVLRVRLRRKRQTNFVIGTSRGLVIPVERLAGPRLKRMLSVADGTSTQTETSDPHHQQQQALVCRTTLSKTNSYKLRLQTTTVPPDDILSPQPRSSVQKILKLTGNMSPNTSLSQDTPSLHNSSQKIRQLTGLDVDLQQLHALHPVEEEAASTRSLPSDASSSSFSLEIEVPEDGSYEPAESVYSPSYAESVDEVLTPLTIPRYINPISITRHIPEAAANESSVAAALRLSGFVAVGASLAPPEEPLPLHHAAAPPTALHTLQEIPPSPPDSTYQHNDADNSDAESVVSAAPSSSAASSSSDESDSALDLEPTTGMLYHDTAISIAKSMGRSSLPQPGGPSPAAAAYLESQKRSGARGSNTPTSGGPSPTSTRFSLRLFRKRESRGPGLSERRGRRPPPLDGINVAAGSTTSPAPPTTNTTSSHPSTSSATAAQSSHPHGRPASSSGWKHTQRTPHPPVSSSIRMAAQESEENQARFSLLARIFTTGGSSSGSGSAASGSASHAGGKRSFSAAAAARRGSTMSSGSGATGMSSGDPSPHHVIISNSHHAGTDHMPMSSWSPDTPDPPGSGSQSEGGGSPGILSRTLDHARQAAGLKTKSERAEHKRETLRGKIKILRSPESHALMTDDNPV